MKRNKYIDISGRQTTASGGLLSKVGPASVTRICKRSSPHGKMHLQYSQLPEPPSRASVSLRPLMKQEVGCSVCYLSRVCESVPGNDKNSKARSGEM